MTHQLVFLTGDVGYVHVVGGRRQIFVLLASEDVESDDVNLGVTVLASLGGRHVNDLARTVLDNDVTVLAQSRALHGEGGRRASVGGVESDIVLYKKTSAIWLHHNNFFALFLMLVGPIHASSLCATSRKGGARKRGAIKMRGSNKTTGRDFSRAGQTGTYLFSRHCDGGGRSNGKTFEEGSIERADLDLGISQKGGKVGKKIEERIDKSTAKKRRFLLWRGSQGPLCLFGTSAGETHRPWLVCCGRCAVS